MLGIIKHLDAKACLNAKRYIHTAPCQNPQKPEGNYQDRFQQKHEYYRAKNTTATVQSQEYQYQAAEPAMTVYKHLL